MRTDFRQLDESTNEKVTECLIDLTRLTVVDSKFCVMGGEFQESIACNGSMIFKSVIVEDSLCS